jgi:hypothetical protein
LKAKPSTKVGESSNQFPVPDERNGKPFKRKIGSLSILDYLLNEEKKRTL